MPKSESTNITLRQAAPGDASGIMQVHRDAAFTMSAKHYDRHILDAWSPVSPERLQGIEKLIQETPDQGLLLVAEMAGRVSGFGRLVFSTAEIASLYVSPNCAGMGLGTKILSELESAARKRGLVSLWLHAALNAEEFYSRCGFTSDCKVEYQLPAGVTMPVIKMHKQLSAE
jgi:putative acetyltransferase